MKMNYLMILICIVLCIACNEKKVGDSVINFSKDDAEILIDNFPRGKQGIEGFNTITYPSGFDFEKVDESIYGFITSNTFHRNHVTIKIRYSGKDQYGKDTVGTWIFIGSFDSAEAKKYADFQTWNKSYGVFKLLANDRKEALAVETSFINPQNFEADQGQTLNIPLRYGGYDFDAAKGENTTNYNQSNANLVKLNWRVLEDVFFKGHLDSYYTEEGDPLGKVAFEPVTFKGSIVHIEYDQYGGTYDFATIEDDALGRIVICYHSLNSGKTIIRPEKTIAVGDLIEGWGAMVKYEGETHYYLNQAVLTK